MSRQFWDGEAPTAFVFFEVRIHRLYFTWRAWERCEQYRGLARIIRPTFGMYPRCEPFPY